MTLAEKINVLFIIGGIFAVIGIISAIICIVLFIIDLKYNFVIEPNEDTEETEKVE